MMICSLANCSIERTRKVIENVSTEDKQDEEGPKEDPNLDTRLKVIDSIAQRFFEEGTSTRDTSIFYGKRIERAISNTFAPGSKAYCNKARVILGSLKVSYLSNL
jgi:hypothetical protein